MFSQSKCKDLWVMILEKVWAKLHGNYQKILQGQSYEVFRDLLGAPGFYVKTNEENFKFQFIEAFKNKYLISGTALPTE